MSVVVVVLGCWLSWLWLLWWWWLLLYPKTPDPSITYIVFLGGLYTPASYRFIHPSIGGPSDP